MIWTLLLAFIFSDWCTDYSQSVNLYIPLLTLEYTLQENVKTQAKTRAILNQIQTLTWSNMQGLRFDKNVLSDQKTLLCHFIMNVEEKTYLTVSYVYSLVFLAWSSRWLQLWPPEIHLLDQSTVSQILWCQRSKYVVRTVK